MHEFALARPSPPLREHVLRYAGARTAGGMPQRARELPIAGTAVVIGLAAPWWVGVGAGPLRRFESFAGGLTLEPVTTAHGGAYELLQLDLTPLGTAAVLGVPGAELAGAVVELSDLLGAEAGRLAERLALAAGWRARFALLDAWLLARVAAARPVRADVVWACRRLEASAGRLPIGALQRELGCSRRHLASRFAEQVGVGPKAYARLLRFNAAADRLRAGDADLARVAAECGFSDQSHLTREVRAFAETTPAALAGVTSLQD